tara:strand:- start:1140 stop:1370 length:231 start_codon:yes stop_codon:yes gene_type:complete
MAEILESFKFKEVGRGSRYPYDQWFDGQIWKLTHLVDFDCQPSSLRQAFYSAARRKDLKIKVSLLSNNDVVVQRID